MNRIHIVSIVAWLLSAPLPNPAIGQEKYAKSAAIDKLLSAYDNTRTPGCAVAVSLNGEVVFSRAYGMADLEHDVPNTTDTIFECGSVSKQFTAAAVILLAIDGKLKLDDDIRKYIPEIPKYSDTITIRQLINHTSGLRDWGSVAALAGWPRGTRTHSHADVLRILARQHSLNHPPGHNFSYTNSGYNLLVILVERVSGRSFAAFSRQRIFEPLGMSRTQWRDDFRRVVKDRAIAYEPARGGWRMEMPFEYVHGNGGLLTTAEDLLKFTHNLTTGDQLGGRRFVDEMHRLGVLADGTATLYASGLFIQEYLGIREVSHRGATAGYRAFLARYPDQGLSFALIANAANMGSRTYRRLADIVLGDALQDRPGHHFRTEHAISAPRLRSFSGGYRDRETGQYVKIDTVGDVLKFGSSRLDATGDNSFLAADGTTLRFLSQDADTKRFTAAIKPSSRPESILDPVPPFQATPLGLQEFTGSYQSEEVGIIYTIRAEADGLHLSFGKRNVVLKPAFPDGFVGPLGTIQFQRDDKGAVNGLTCHGARVWSMRFERISIAD